MNIPDLFKSKQFTLGLKILGGLILVLGIFQLGLFVGFHKAGYSYRWGENYHRAFGGPRGGFMNDFKRDFDGRDFINGHGTTGTIIKIDESSLVIKGRDDMEKIVNVNNKTSIKNGRTNMVFTNLKVDDTVVIIGSPKDDGSIDAKIIRVFSPSTPPSSVPVTGSIVPGQQR